MNLGQFNQYNSHSQLQSLLHFTATLSIYLDVRLFDRHLVSSGRQIFDHYKGINIISQIILRTSYWFQNIPFSVFKLHKRIMIFGVYIYVTLDHKTNIKSLGYICSHSQKHIVWGKIINFSFMPKIRRILSKDHVPWRYFVHFFKLTLKTGFVAQGHIWYVIY